MGRREQREAAVLAHLYPGGEEQQPASEHVRLAQLRCCTCAADLASSSMAKNNSYRVLADGALRQALTAAHGVSEGAQWGPAVGTLPRGVCESCRRYFTRWAEAPGDEKVAFIARGWSTQDCGTGDCNQCKRLSEGQPQDTAHTAVRRQRRDHKLTHPDLRTAEPQSDLQRFLAQAAGVRGLNAVDGTVVVSASVINALVAGYEKASSAGLLDGDVADYWMLHAQEIVPGLGAKLDQLGNLLHKKLGPSTRRGSGADTPPVKPSDMKEALEEAHATIVWDVILGLARRSGVSHQAARQEKDEVRVTAMINFLLYLRNQKWSWMARDITLSLGERLPNTQTDLLNRFGVTMTARAGTYHRGLDAKAHPGAVESFFVQHKESLISLMIDDFSKIYLQRRPNGAHRWGVQQYATLLVKAFPDSPCVPAGAPLHDPDGINVPRVSQFFDTHTELMLNKEFESLMPGE